MKEKTYQVKGMHCASCEILIERKLLEIPGVKAAEASTPKGQVMVEYEGDQPQTGKINQLFKEENYVFADVGAIGEKKEASGDLGTLTAVLILVIAGFVLLNISGLGGLIKVNAQSSLIMFLALGIVAGLSSCAALVGGIVLSMSKQWYGLYADKKTTLEKLQPHLLFNLGRITAFGVFGGILGLLGNRIGVLFTSFSPFLVIGVAIMMLVLGLQMLGVSYFQRFQFTAPKFLIRYVADEGNFKGQYMPFLMGAFTFFLPCGFTLTAQSMALISGNALSGALIMLAFVSGTTPTLLGIGLSSVKFSDNQQFSGLFSKAAGALVLIFALFNLNAQFNVLGISSLSDLRPVSGQTTQAVQDGLPPIVEGKQLLKMNASVSGYEPNHFRVKVGVPVRWEITDTGTSGCTNAIISRSLFDGQINLTPGQTSIKEFTPTKTGKYKFSCWMGMVSGVMEVVDGQVGGSLVKSASAADNGVISSGASGCGCGGR